MGASGRSSESQCELRHVPRRLMNVHFLCFVPKFATSATMRENMQQLEMVPTSRRLNTTRRFLDVLLVQAGLAGAVLSTVTQGPGSVMLYLSVCLHNHRAAPRNVAHFTLALGTSARSTQGLLPLLFLWTKQATWPYLILKGTRNGNGNPIS